MLPDFVIIGAQKGGTSSLYQYLAQHPDVGARPEKEVHYFGWAYGRGEPWYRANFPTATYRVALRQALTRRRILTGEATPYYLFHPRVPDGCARSCPRLDLIVLLRNPVDRAVSSYKHQVRQGRESLAVRGGASNAEQERLAVDAERRFA